MKVMILTEEMESIVNRLADHLSECGCDDCRRNRGLISVSLAEATPLSSNGDPDPVRQAALETVLLAAITQEGDLDLSKLVVDLYHASTAGITWN